MDVKLTVICT